MSTYGKDRWGEKIRRSNYEFLLRSNFGLQITMPAGTPMSVLEHKHARANVHTYMQPHLDVNCEECDPGEISDVEDGS